MTEEDIKKLQSTGGEHLAATEKNILGNDLEAVWDVVKSLKGGRIDFVLDNAGFELYCDLVYGTSQRGPLPVSHGVTYDGGYQPITLFSLVTSRRSISMGSDSLGLLVTSRGMTGTG